VCRERVYWDDVIIRGKIWLRLCRTYPLNRGITIPVLCVDDVRSASSSGGDGCGASRWQPFGTEGVFYSRTKWIDQYLR
jgi:hypothetical protein